LSVLALLCAPAARGLFKRAVVESGHLDLFQSVTAARRATEIVLRDLFIDADGDVLAGLRSTSVLRIASVQRKHGIGLGCFPLVCDGVTLDSDPAAALADASARGIDMLIGSNSEEDRLFRLTGWAPSSRSLAAAAASLLPAADARDRAVELYTDAQAELGLDDAAIDSLMATEHAWTEPVRATALAHARAGGRTYHYELALKSAVPALGAAHLIDVPFFFDNLAQVGVDALLGTDVTGDPAAQALSGALGAALAAFVTDGDPGGPLGEWPPYDDVDRATMVLDRESHVEHARLADRLDFWSAHRAGSASPFAATVGGAG